MLVGAAGGAPRRTRRSSIRACWSCCCCTRPLILLFWHAPALVHWHGVSPVKSLFFSAVACFRNFGALLVYGLAWLAVFIGDRLRLQH